MCFFRNTRTSQQGLEVANQCDLTDVHRMLPRQQQTHLCGHAHMAPLPKQTVCQAVGQNSAHWKFGVSSDHMDLY